MFTDKSMLTRSEMKQALYWRAMCRMSRMMGVEYGRAVFGRGSGFQSFCTSEAGKRLLDACLRFNDGEESPLTRQITLIYSYEVAR